MVILWYASTKGNLMSYVLYRCELEVKSIVYLSQSQYSPHYIFSIEPKLGRG